GLTEQIEHEAQAINQDLFLGRVSVQHKDLYKVMTQKGEIHAQVTGKMAYQTIGIQDFPAVGDWVMLDRETNETGNAMIHHILSRKSTLERKVAGNRSDHQIVATNVDTVFLCMALNSDFNLRRLERYIAMAYSSGSNPVIILTKSDICEDIASHVEDIQQIAFGIDIIVSSSVELTGYEQLSLYIQSGKTVAFIGSSGIGKSTMINHIMGSDLLKTNDLRGDEKGKHTTTHRQLLIAPEGGIIIDTPGMKELGMVSGDLDSSFSDIEELSAQCKFSDCGHEFEPKCAVRAAIERGQLDEDRFESYKKLQRELKYQDLKAKKLEREKINSMFGSFGGMKQAKKMQQAKKNRR
ncbi:MAG: ribosome small subunit-dependent GTPase A, partial [Turicibacter sp.]